MSPEQASRAPPVRRDYRLLARFVACAVIAMALSWAMGLGIAWEWVPGPLQIPLIWGTLLADFALIGFVFAPVWWGIRCTGCGRRIFSAPVRPGGGRAKPLRFYCPTCDVDWDTGIRGND